MIDWTYPPFSESSLRGYYDSPYSFEETVARVHAASGQPVRSTDDYKTSVCFEGTYKGAYFRVYDYKEDRELHIGGGSDLDVRGLLIALASAVERAEPKAYTAKEYYNKCKGYQWP